MSGPDTSKLQQFHNAAQRVQPTHRGRIAEAKKAHYIGDVTASQIKKAHMSMRHPPRLPVQEFDAEKYLNRSRNSVPRVPTKA